MPERVVFSVRRLGHRVIESVWRMGVSTRFFGLLLLNSSGCFRRPHLIVREIFSSGVLSLIIILVSGLFVGMVLGLQGYETLQTYGSEEALGVLVSLSRLAGDR